MRTTSTTQTTSTTMTRTPTRAKLHNEWARHVERAVSVFLDVCVTRTSWLKMFLSLTSCHLHAWASLLDLAFFPFYFDLTFSVFFHFSVLMHPEPHTDLNNLKSMRHNLRTSAKGSNDAYDVSVSFTHHDEDPSWFLLIIEFLNWRCCLRSRRCGCCTLRSKFLPACTYPCQHSLALCPQLPHDLQ